MSLKRLLFTWLTVILAGGLGVAVADEVKTENVAEAEPVRTEPTVVMPQAVEVRSLQAVLDERRDRLQQRREEFFERYSGRRWFTPPWQLAYQDRMDELRDDMRGLHRQQRDMARLHQDRMRVFTDPWAQHWHNLSEIRSYNGQMAQLDRIEAMENLRYHRPFGFFW